MGSHAQGTVHLSGGAKELAAADHITPTAKSREQLGNTGMLGFSLCNSESPAQGMAPHIVVRSSHLN